MDKTTKWNDLRYDSRNLPESSCKVLVCCKFVDMPATISYALGYYHDGHWSLFDTGLDTAVYWGTARVIAWAYFDEFSDY